MRWILKICVHLAGCFELGWFPYNYFKFNEADYCDKECQSNYLLNVIINYNIICILVPILVLYLIIDLVVLIYMLQLYFKVVKLNFDAVPRDQVLYNMIPAVTLEDLAATKILYIPASIASQLRMKTLTYENFKA
jgi:hypothetical protein